MILHWVICTFMVAGCLGLLQRFHVINYSKRALSITLDSLGTMQNPALDDDAKEAALRRHSIQLFKTAFIMIPGIAGALGIPLILALYLDHMGWISNESLVSVAVSPAFITASVLITLIIAPKLAGNDRSSTYSGMDQMLHRIAFRSGLAQRWMANLESRFLAGKLHSNCDDRPVFITALPRAGTTLLLECLSDHPQLASHCYRDMPFVLTPCLWNRFSNRFHRKGIRSERAHGDGMQIDYDSPEALEEVVWKNFWHTQYKEDRISPWGETVNGDFITFFKDHQRKIILTRRSRDSGTARYLSKNNLNIARISFLHRHYPDATIIIPFRDPLQHASSLLKQHKNFCRLHSTDSFAAEYMEAIGHYDFGSNLRPIDFNGWLDRRMAADANEFTFWIEYWLASYEALLVEAQNIPIHFLFYDRLCRQPEKDLVLLGQTLGLNGLDSLQQHARDIHPPRPHEVEPSDIEPALYKRVQIVYDQLQALCLNKQETSNAADKTAQLTHPAPA